MIKKKKDKPVTATEVLVCPQRKQSPPHNCAKYLTVSLPKTGKPEADKIFKKIKEYSEITNYSKNIHQAKHFL